jgi:5-formyltetrahydrofolate cyclo-ligase
MVKQAKNCADNQHSRRTLRNHYRQLRRNLKACQQQQAALALSKQLIRSRYFLRAKNIAVYWPDDGEISLLPFIEQAWAMKKRIFLPVITQAGQMQFAQLTPHSSLIDGRWGIPQPLSTRVVKPLILDTLLLPLVAFDTNGNRLGRGGGFYDRFLALLSRDSSNTHKRHKNSIIIGVAHRCQQAKSIPTESWDIPVDAVITDKAIHITS